nr:hypothetical protein [uncultured Mitsuokella sp.]
MQSLLIPDACFRDILFNVVAVFIKMANATLACSADMVITHGRLLVELHGLIIIHFGAEAFFVHVAEQRCNGHVV